LGVEIRDLLHFVDFDPFQRPLAENFQGHFWGPQTFVNAVGIVTKSISGFEL